MYGKNFQQSRTSNSEVSGRIWQEFEPIHDSVPITCKFNEDAIKNEGTIVSTTFSPF